MRGGRGGTGHVPALPLDAGRTRQRCERCAAPTFAVLGPNDEPIRWCTRKGCHFTWWEATRAARPPTPWSRSASRTTGRGIAPRGPPEALRAVLHHQGRARHRARPGDHLGHRRGPRRDDRGRQREGRRQPFHRPPAARCRGTHEGRGMTDCDVLVIDDEPVVRDGGAPRARGGRAARGDRGRRRVRPAHPALATCRLVLCDLMLPDRSGFEVLHDLGAPSPRPAGRADHRVRDARPRRARAGSGRRRLPRQAVRARRAHGLRAAGPRKPGRGEGGEDDDRPDRRPAVRSASC